MCDATAALHSDSNSGAGGSVQTRFASLRSADGNGA